MVHATNLIISTFFKKEVKGSSSENETEEGQSPPADDTAETDYLLNLEERKEALTDLKKEVNCLVNLFRQLFIDRFISSYRDHTPSKINPDLCLAFFDCLLDESVTSFKLTSKKKRRCHPFQKVIDPVKLLSVISLQRSALLPSNPHQSSNSQLQTLGLSFSHKMKVPLFPNVISFLTEFQHLTSLCLSLNNAGTIDLLPFCTTLGDACPQLGSLELELDDSSLSKSYVLALVLGKRLGLFPEQTLNDCRFAHLQFTSGSCTPICKTLRQFKILSYDWVIPSGVVAFILRHFPNLQEFTQSTSLSFPNPFAVELLWEQQQLLTHPDSPLLSISGQNSDELGHIEWIINAPFEGIYFLPLI